MLQFKGGLSRIKFEKKKYLKSLEKAVGEVFRQAIREWLRSVILNVPVKTGHARGSLKPLGAFLRVAVPIKPKAGERNKSGTGANQSKFIIIDDKTNPGQGKFVFEWRSDVFHYYLNEFGFVHGPWGSIEAGEQAFFNYLETNLERRLPDFRLYITTEKTELI